MRTLRGFLVLGVVTAAAVAAAVWSQRSETPEVSQGELLLPGLIERINDVTGIVVESTEGKLSIAREDGRWVVPDKHGYPANVEEIRRLLIGAAELRRIEPKTSKPEQFAKLELEDPGEGAQSIGYTLQGAGGTAIAALVVGKQEVLSGAGDASQYYVRVPGEPQAWLVEGRIPKSRLATDWLADEVLKIAPERVHRTTVRHPDTTVVRAVKSAPGQASFTLLGVPPGKEVDSDYNVHSLATTAADLTLSDVAPLEEASFEEPGLHVTLETFDGLRIIVETGKKDDQELLRLRAEHDPTLAALFASPGGDGAAAGATPALKPAAEVAEEVKALNARWSGWAYGVARYHLDTLRKTMDTLVKAPEAETKSPSETAPETTPGQPGEGGGAQGG